MRLFKYHLNKKTRKLINHINEIPKKIIRKIRHRKGKKGIIMLDNEVIERLKQYTEGKNLKRKYIHVSLSEKAKLREDIKKLF
tara:strand:- start:632 stop:880 length:249 start_codon:yes stop_codon:yes gene_type:complete